MPLAIVLSALKSRAIRAKITGSSGIAGVRRFSTSALQTASSQQGGFQAIWAGFSRFGGFILSQLQDKFKGLTQINFSKIWSLITNAGIFLWNFNWNATDEQLDQQIKAGLVALAGAAGRTLGSTLGYTICGVVPAASMVVFNQPLGILLLKEVGEEMAREVASHLANLINLAAQQLVRYTFINIFKNHRNLLRGAALKFAQMLVNAGVLSQASVDKANKNKNEPWSFAMALEETIDEIKDPIRKEFIEEFYEELGDACIEAGYVVAGGLDNFLAMQKLSNNNIFGKEATVEILLNRSTPVIRGATP